MTSPSKRAVLLLIGMCLVLASCAHQPDARVFGGPGFWMGLVHGAIAPFALIAHLFTDVRVYAFPNSGGWYDFGFLLGMAAIWGGGGAAARR
jgi:hypothetical protein